MNEKNQLQEIHTACHIILSLWLQYSGRGDEHSRPDFVKKSKTLSIPTCCGTDEDATDFLEKYGYAVDDCTGHANITFTGLQVLMLEEYYLGE